MKAFNTLSGLGRALFGLAVFASSSAVMAQAFVADTSPSLGAMVKNVGRSVVEIGDVAQGILYSLAFVFFVVSVIGFNAYRKDNRSTSIMIPVGAFGIAIICAFAPTIIGSGAVTTVGAGAQSSTRGAF